MVKVTRWQPVMGKPLPEPVIEDDSEHFDPQAVKNVRDWLVSTAQAFINGKPTPMTIFLTNELLSPWTIVTTIGAGIKEEVIFKHATIELHLVDKRTKKVVATYHYLVARTSDNKRDIVGPQLKVLQHSNPEPLIVVTSMPVELL